MKQEIKYALVFGGMENLVKRINAELWETRNYSNACVKFSCRYFGILKLTKYFK